MMKRIKIGLIGCGAIGSELASFIAKNLGGYATLAYINDQLPARAEAVVKKLGKRVQILPNPEVLRRSDFIIEAASAKISGSIAIAALRLNKQILVMSVGGLIDPKIARSLASLKTGRMWIPSGALAGIDAVLAAREGKIRNATLVTRKPPKALTGAPHFDQQPFPQLKGLEEVCVFRGNAFQAVKAFPQNINVAAALSLASLGPKKTLVEIWTSNRYQKNRHEVMVEGDFGEIRTSTENVPSPTNPKTSRLAILSATALLKKIFSPIRLGT